MIGGAPFCQCADPGVGCAARQSRSLSRSTKTRLPSALFSHVLNEWSDASDTARYLAAAAGNATHAASIAVMASITMRMIPSQRLLSQDHHCCRGPIREVSRGCAACSMCHRSKTRTASGGRASATVWSRSTPLTPTASRRCCLGRHSRCDAAQAELHCQLEQMRSADGRRPGQTRDSARPRFSTHRFFRWVPSLLGLAFTCA